MRKRESEKPGSWPTISRRPNRRRRVALRLEDWPEADRRLWAAAIQAAELFDEPGAAAHLRPATRKSGIDSYGRWLAHLAAIGPMALSHPPADRVTPERIESFCRRLARTNSGRSAASTLHKMRHMLVLLAPATNWDWLHAIAKRIHHASRPRSKAARLRMSDELYRLGLELMAAAEAESALYTRIRQRVALTHRDGLMIALLAADPIRRSNFAGLTLGRSIVQTGSVWTIVLEEGETKGGRALEYQVPPLLGAKVDRYLAAFRPAIHNSQAHAGLWASAKGCPMKGGAIYHAVCRRTKAAFGHSVYLHLFRDAAATFWSVEEPETIHGARDLLGHVKFETTDRHYRHARTIMAGRAYASILERTVCPQSLK